MVETVSFDFELYITFVDRILSSCFASDTSRPPREPFYDLYFKCATPAIRLRIMLSCASHFNSSLSKKSSLTRRSDINPVE